MIVNSHGTTYEGTHLNAEDEVTIKSISDVKEYRLPGFKLPYKEVKIDLRNNYNLKIYLPRNENREFNDALNYFKKAKDWPNFFLLKNNFIDLRNREASTIHKAQGSTYDFVILIMDDIFSCRDVSQLRRMLYVAASRAKDVVYIYDKDIYSKPRKIYQ